MHWVLLYPIKGLDGLSELVIDPTWLESNTCVERWNILSTLNRSASLVRSSLITYVITMKLWWFFENRILSELDWFQARRLPRIIHHRLCQTKIKRKNCLMPRHQLIGQRKNTFKASKIVSESDAAGFEPRLRGSCILPAARACTAAADLAIV